jgi:hypothetical protein
MSATIISLIARFLFVVRATFLVHSTQVLYWLFTSAIRIKLDIPLPSAALLFLDTTAQILLANTEPVPPNNPGGWIEDRVGANATEYEVANDFRGNHATSIKSSRRTAERVLREIEKEAQTMHGKTTFQPRSSTPPSTLPQMGVQTHAVIMVIPENHGDFLGNRAFMAQVRKLVQQTRVIIRVIPLRGWEP